ncbi:hypothetical protein F5Y16DRAFT_289535 [Xylariaceae sp. FL0255]|nr:hypothetical protein F5Y16DRAFT_289535 [Xylariaceae sp. FL0255]
MQKVDPDHGYMMIQTQQQVSELSSLSDARAVYVQHHLNHIRHELFFFKRLLVDKSEKQPLGDATSSNQVDVSGKQAEIGELNEILQKSVKSAKAKTFAVDPFQYPFIIVSTSSEGIAPAAEPTKLTLVDSTTENWIKNHVLDRSEISFELTTDGKKYIGPGPDDVHALGKVSLIWYSLDPALVKETTFLVGEGFPPM